MVCSTAELLKRPCASLSPGTCQNADPIGLGWGLKLFMSNKLPADADVAGPRAMSNRALGSL